METKDININVSSDTKETVIRFGDALPLPEEEKFEFIGNIESPFTFAEARTVNKVDAVVEYSFDKKRIIFNENIHQSLAPRITGLIVENDMLQKFKINNGEFWDLQAFSKHIRLNSTLFESRQYALDLSAKFSNFKAKVSTVLEGNTNHRTGDFRKLIDKSVENGLPESFKMKCDLFKNMSIEKSEFNVEVCVDATDSSLKIWLESPELVELELNLAAKLIQDEVMKFNQAEFICIGQI